MTSLDQIILKETNPFDPITFRSGNFWNENHKQAIDSIHQNDFNYICEKVKLVAEDQKSRSIFLTGDSGCGKSYLLGRLKRELNYIAFFVYIDPCPDSEHIWRHTLRYTVDSLMHIPEGETESQLQLWLKGLSAFKEKTLIGKLLGEKAQFVSNFCATYPGGLFEPKQFFSVLYELAAHPENQFIACEWLKGAILDDNDLKILGVKSVIDSESAARGIMANFGRIAEATKPIVLCFDQVESGNKLADNSIDISPSFKVNTTIHNEFLRNFCVIVSIIKQSWELNKKNIPQSDFARFEGKIELKKINLEQALALWKLRLLPLHEQVNPKPESEIAPLKKEDLEQNARGNKINLRVSLQLGNKLFSEYKRKIIPIDLLPPKNSELTAFNLTWQNEFTKQEKNITYIKYLASIDLKTMLKNSLECLENKTIKDRFLPSSTFAPYFFISEIKNQKKGLFWYEESSLRSFGAGIKACQKVFDSKNKETDSLILIRSEKLGTIRNMCYKDYQKLFKNNHQNEHIIPDLKSVHYLRTYQVLANAAQSGELLVNNEEINLEEYQELVRKSGVLNDCILLQKLGVVEEKIRDIQPLIIDPKKVKDIVISIIKNSQFLAKKVIINNVINLLPTATELVINQVIQELCEEKIIQIINPEDKPEEQSICLIPSAIIF